MGGDPRQTSAWGKSCDPHAVRHAVRLNHGALRCTSQADDHPMGQSITTAKPSPSVKT